MADPYCRIAPDTRGNLHTYVPGYHPVIVRSEIGVDIGDQDFPSCHSGIILLIRMEAVVPFSVVGSVVGHKLLEGIVFFVLPCLVGLVADLFLVCAPLTFAIEASHFLTVLMDYAPLLGSVERLSLFLL